MKHFFLFFFSSRRRHTRCLSDWSSDVCSSDLSVLASSGIAVQVKGDYTHGRDRSEASGQNERPRSGESKSACRGGVCARGMNSGDDRKYEQHYQHQSFRDLHGFLLCCLHGCVCSRGRVWKCTPFTELADFVVPHPPDSRLCYLKCAQGSKYRASLVFCSYISPPM